MLNNKKGISGIILTLIMIVLVIVAVGIVWYVVNNVLTQQTEAIDYASKCLGLNFEVEMLGCSPGTINDCKTRVTRASGSSGEAIDGFEVTWIHGTTSYTADDPYTGNIPTSKTVEENLGGLGLSSAPNESEVRIYFEEEDGTKHYCNQVFSSE